MDGGDIRVRRFRRWVDRPVEVGGLEVVGARNWRETLRDTLSNLAGGVGGVGRIGSDVSGGNGSVSDGQDTGKGEEDVSVVDLQAGGWSFTARDSNGGVWVWGEVLLPRITMLSPSWIDYADSMYCLQARWTERSSHGERRLGQINTLKYRNRVGSLCHVMPSLSVLDENIYSYLIRTISFGNSVLGAGYVYDLRSPFLPQNTWLLTLFLGKFWA